MKNKLVSVVVVTKDRKKDLEACINSYLLSTYHPIEIIVVDNASKQPIISWLPKKYPTVKIITSKFNLGAAAGRNVGLKETEGEYIVFTDDDASCDRRMVTNLVDVFKKKREAGIVQPLVYDKDQRSMLQGAGHDINLTTGRIKAWGVREEDRDQYDGIREVPMCGCVWMVKREVIKKIGNFDEEYFIPYEDSDFCERARREKFKLYCFSDAKTWHRGHKSTYVHSWIEWLGITTPERAYRISRNKIIFMKKHSPFPNNLIFFFIFFPMYIFLHSLIIISARRIDVLVKYWLGVLSGIWYAVTFKLIKNLLRIHSEIDEKLLPVKIFFLGWTDPLTSVINKSGESILDLGCGQGKIMKMIKIRMNVKRAVGVDLFKPYIDEAKSFKTHDTFFMQDVRKINFPPRSFDIVIASHLLEHLPKEDSWQLLKKMETIAKKQIIIATPIGEMPNPIEDKNPLQAHVSFFYPEEFSEKGYKIIKYGWRWLIGDIGLAIKVKNPIIRKILFAFNLIVTPIYYFFPQSCDYIFVAYKNVHGYVKA